MKRPVSCSLMQESMPDPHSACTGWHVWAPATPSAENTVGRMQSPLHNPAIPIRGQVPKLWGNTNLDETAGSVPFTDVDEMWSMLPRALLSHFPQL